METLLALNLLLSPHFTFFDGSRSLPSPLLPVWFAHHPFFHVQLSPSEIEKSLIFFPPVAGFKAWETGSSFSLIHGGSLSVISIPGRP